ncbi:uncharacterized protein N7443_004581 [Penicillium atrosanguineum]|uniref:uncharacterized protein n=1 Tax=Penicillium atrosanguineum TaxID=1132637 RepID=UPI0023A081CE|nr:uncharacterized protein N7443_004581 [Penicillium atrosanguineum]KAJ5304921.1 hypothetical protein N7443_004581 [Penicillium atrosanguineum]
MSETSTMKHPRRIITPARKEQNRLAQRAYRQRRKERLGGEHVIRKCAAKEIHPAPTGRNVKTVPKVDDAHSHPTHPRNTAPFTLTLDHLFPSLQDHCPKHDGVKETESATFEPNMGNEDYNIDLPADPLAITLESTHTHLLRACFYNANSLGISIQEFSTLRCMSLCSPFYRPHTTMSDEPGVLLAAVSTPLYPSSSSANPAPDSIPPPSATRFAAVS